MNTRSKIAVFVICGGLALGVTAQAKEKEHQEENISSSAIPAAVQSAAKSEAKGAKIIRWEKEGANYEAIIDKNGKETGIAITSDGKVVNRHSEKAEHKEKGEKD